MEVEIVIKKTALFIAVFLLPLLTGCASLGDLFSHTKYTYNIEKLSEAEGYRPDVVWIYPAADDMAQVQGEENIHGASYEVEGVDNIPLWGQEPPLVMDWMVGPDSEIIIVEALDYEFELRVGETNIHNYWLPNATRLRIYALRGDSGEMLWEIPLEGFKADTLEWFYIDEKLMGIEFKEYGIDGSVASTTYSAFRLDGSGLAYQQSFNQAAQNFFVEKESNTVHILFADPKYSIVEGKEVLSDIIRKWVVLDADSGGMLWQKELSAEQTILHIPAGGLVINEGDQLLKLDSLTGSSSVSAPFSDLDWIKPLGDWLVMGNSEGFRIMDINSKRILWSKTGDRSLSSFTLLDNKILISRVDGTFEEPPEMKKTPSLTRYYKDWDPHNNDVYGFYENFNTDLELLDLKTGKSLWNSTVEDRMNSNVILRNGDLVLTTTKNLLLIDGKEGKVLSQEELPWGIWPVGISIIPYGNSLVIETDRHVALWNQNESYKRIHEFHPLWESISSDAVYYDLRAGYWVLENMLGAPVEPNWLIASQNENNQWQKEMKKQFIVMQQQMQAADLNRSITVLNNTLYMDMKYNKYHGINNNPYSYGPDMAAAAATQNMAMVGSLAAWSRSVNLKAMGMMFANNQACYPLVKQQIQHLSDLDLHPWIIRLTSSGLENSVSKLELFNLDTGEIKEIVLGPRQAPDVVDKTMANGAVGLGIFGGYLNYTHLYPLNFRVLIDWENKRLIHYGPGFEMENHISFGRKKNLRSFIYSRDISRLME